jgi:hypothetical protein
LWKAYAHAAGGGLLLASASQDRTLRIWAISPAGSGQAAENGGHALHGMGGEGESSSSLAKAIAR